MDKDLTPKSDGLITESFNDQTVEIKNQQFPSDAEKIEQDKRTLVDEYVNSTISSSTQSNPTVENSNEQIKTVSSRPELFQGTRRFKVQRKLGEGAFGVVYQAFDNLKNTVIALKVLRQPDPDQIYRFKREFRSLTDVVNPHLVTLFELLSDDNFWFFTMEYVEGVTFSEHIRQFQGEEKFDQIRSSFAQLAEGISTLHEAGKLHRDIKPSNVLVTKDNRVVILDFGLITELAPEEYRQSLTLAGTPAYMSPEQAINLPLTESSDWYCVGAMLYESLTGKLPFSSGSILEVLRRKQTELPVAPSKLINGIPEDLEALCLNLLNPNPKERPTGREVLLRLGHVQVESTSSAIHISSTGVEMPFVGRKTHLSELEEAFSAVQNGNPAVAHVFGNSGMGKSALVKQFLKNLQQRENDVVVLSGRCYEQESVPYKAFDSLIDGLSKYLKRLPAQTAESLLPRDVHALTRLFPVLRQVEVVANARRRLHEIPDEQELRRRAFLALRELLARLTDQKNVVLFIDDFQWGDIDSVNLINELLIPPDAPELLLIVSYRSEDRERSPALGMLLQLTKKLESSVVTRMIKVGELEASEAKSLAAELLSKESNSSAQYAETIARESGASPFFIHELVRYSAATIDKTQNNTTEARLQYKKIENTTLDEVIRARALTLPKQVRRFLEIVAVAGQPIDLLP